MAELDWRNLRKGGGGGTPPKYRYLTKYMPPLEVHPSRATKHVHRGARSQTATKSHEFKQRSDNVCQVAPCLDPTPGQPLKGSSYISHGQGKHQSVGPLRPSIAFPSVLSLPVGRDLATTTAFARGRLCKACENMLESQPDQ